MVTVASREGRKESLQLCLCNLNSTSNSPVAPNDWAVRFRQSARSGNEHECEQTLKTHAKGNDVTTNVISTNQRKFSHRLFRCRYSNSRDVVTSSPFFSCSVARAPRRACCKLSYSRKQSKKMGNESKARDREEKKDLLCRLVFVHLQHETLATILSFFLHVQ